MMILHPNTKNSKIQKSILLDCFAGAGGAGEGYKQAGFHVVGVDINPQPHNPHEFYQDDALAVLDVLLDGQTWNGYQLSDFAAIHASPPCQSYSKSRHIAKVSGAVVAAPKLIQPVRKRLERTGLPWVIENVEGSELPDALELCGSMFGLPIRRHRWFSSNVFLWSPGPCKHADAFYNVVGRHVFGYGKYTSGRTYLDKQGRIHKREGEYRLEDGMAAMGIDWKMSLAELSQAIPPAYTEYIGKQLMAIITSAMEVAL